MDERIAMREYKALEAERAICDARIAELEACLVQSDNDHEVVLKMAHDYVVAAWGNRDFCSFENIASDAVKQARALIAAARDVK